MGSIRHPAPDRGNLVDGEYCLKDLVDLDALRGMFEDFSKATGFTASLVSYPDQEVLVATGWRDVCTKFHRACPESFLRCRESDSELAARLKERKGPDIGPCANGLVNGATPVVIRDVHVASLATGQVMLEAPDLERFRRQAEACGYDPDAYLAAVKQVPVVSPEQFRHALAFLGRMAVMIGELGLSCLETREAAERLRSERNDLDRAEQQLRESEEKYRLISDNITDVIILCDNEGICTYASPSYQRVLGGEDPVGRSIFSYVHAGDVDDVAAVFRQAMDNRSAGQAVFRYLHPSLGSVWLEAKGQVVDMHGAPAAVISTRDITERKRMEEELNRSEVKYRTIFENATEGIFQNTPEGRFISVNPALARMFGYDSPQEMVENVADMGRQHYADPEDRERMLRLLEECGAVEGFEAEFLDRDGRRSLWGSVNSHAVRDASGKILYLEGTVVDITERKQARDELREANTRLSALVRTIPDIVYFKDISGKNLEVNRAYEELTGLSREDIIGRTDTEILPEPLARQCLESDRKAMAMDAPLRIEESFTLGDGRTVFFDSYKAPILNEQGEVEGLIGVSRDITGRKLSEQALRDSESRYRFLTEKMGDMAFIIDTGLRTVYMNPAVERILGYTPEERMALELKDQLTPESITRAFEVLSEELRKDRDGADPGRYVMLELEHYHKDGSTRLLETCCRALHDDRGKVTGIYCISRDITERKRAEEALRRSEERLDLALKGADLGTWDWDIETGRVILNERWAGMLGYTLDEIAPEARSWERLVHPDDWEKTVTALNAHLEGKTPSFEHEYRLRTRTGEWRWVLDKGKVTERDAAGRPLRAVGTHLDITDRIRAQQERAQLDNRVRQTQKAESLGRMAGAIAHHFNNQLAVVIGNLEMIMSGLPEGQDLEESVSNAMKGASRASEVSRLMLTYLGQTPSRGRPLDLSVLCRETIPMLQAVVPAKTRLATDLPDPGPVVRADEGQIRQVLMNLATNAWESIGDASGAVSISLQRVSAGEIQTSGIFHLDWQPEEEAYACLSVSDTGCGMTRDVLAALFDPFFSTKFTGRGLGLPVTAGIVRAHKGGICAESEPGKGSVFRVYLPVSGLKPDAPVRPDVPVSEKGRVLLAEDDAMVLKMTSGMLARLGYEVVQATDGAEALGRFREIPSDFSYVILDVTMPSMDGWETMHAIRLIRHDIPVILTSGYSEAQVMKAGVDDLPQAFIQKPFRLKDLKSALEKAASGTFPLHTGPGD